MSTPPSSHDCLDLSENSPEYASSGHLAGTALRSGETPRSRSQRSRQSDSQSSLYYEPSEPIFKIFLCPLTKEIMQEPVIITESRQTCEKAAIEKWFDECEKNGRPLVCPMTRIPVNGTTSLIPNLALQEAIEEWTSRRETEQFEKARITLATTNSSDQNKLHALKNVHALCSRNHANKRKVRCCGLIPLIADNLRNGEELQYEAFLTLHILSTNDDDNKVEIGHTDAISWCFHCLSHPETEKEAVDLLTELSTNELVCEQIVAVKRPLLHLIRLASRSSENALTGEKADKILVSLEGNEQNIRTMAENGRLHPLLRQFVEATDEKQQELASYLADLSLSTRGKIEVARIAGSSLVKMLDGEISAGMMAALKCLSEVSAVAETGIILVEAGVLQTLARDLSVSSLDNLPMKVKEMLAIVLANVVNSGVDLISLPVPLISEDVLHSLLQSIQATGSFFEGKMLQVFVGLAASPAANTNLVNAILKGEASSTILKCVVGLRKEIRSNCLKLLHLISPFMGQALADGLCAGQGQGQELGVLVKLLGSNGITEEQAAAAGFLANLPGSHVSLTQLMIREEAPFVVAERLCELYLEGSSPVGSGSRHMIDLKVGLVTILCRFTYALNDQASIDLAQELNLMSLFTKLLRLGEVDKIKQQSALALQKLSGCSKTLSHAPRTKKKTGLVKKLFKARSVRMVLEPCRVHGGICSARYSFCLVDGDAEAIVVLGSHLDHMNQEVVLACLGALATLLDDVTAVPKEGVRVINRARLIPAVVEIMKSHKSDMLWSCSVWMVSKFLNNPDVAHFFSLDQSIYAALVEAFHKGSPDTRQAAEMALKKLGKMYK